jgi:hypothetical protein
MALRRDGKMIINLGKWEYSLSINGLKLVRYNIYATSWVNIIN